MWRYFSKHRRWMAKESEINKVLGVVHCPGCQIEYPEVPREKGIWFNLVTQKDKSYEKYGHNYRFALGKCLNCQIDLGIMDDSLPQTRYKYTWYIINEIPNL